ncbi:MAG: GH1 family beta-glucosidase [Rectinemataceae bacterium]
MRTDHALRLDGIPSDFVWGCATAAYQIEGSTSADGRGPSIWDNFVRLPGAVLGGMNGDLACDSYRRWREDVELLRRLGVGAYRFSVAWPRIQASGAGSPNASGLGHYGRLVDALLEAGIEPAVTLYHWDLPQALEESGGWPERDTAYRFADYADIVLRTLGDRVKRWFSLNEPWCSSHLGYALGIHAPGKKDRRTAYRAVHHLLLAHGLAVRACRAVAPGAEIGIVLNPRTPRPARRRPEDLTAASRAADERTALWLDPLYGRGYPERHLAAYPEIAMPVEDGDMAAIAEPTDFLGVNYYSEEAVEAAPVGPEHPEGYRPVSGWRERTEMDWDIVPEGLGRQTGYIAENWPVKAIYITENGGAFPDAAGADGRVRDRDRIAYMKSHIASCARSIARGVPLKGYFAWSLLDNFEWSHGYSKRFGLVAVDFATGERRPKDSFWFYRDLIAGYEE